jgi:hypothetical protein
MDSFSVLKQDHTQVLAARLRNPAPEANTAVSLYELGIRILHDMLNPLIADFPAIRSSSDECKILRDPHA